MNRKEVNMENNNCKIRADSNKEVDSLKMYSVEDLASLFQTTNHTILEMKDIGIIKPIKIGKRFMFSQSELIRFQNEYIGMDLSNKIEMQKSYRLVNPGTN